MQAQVSQPNTINQAFPHLQGQACMSLVTYKKSGAEVKTPVQFAQQGAVLYIMTIETTGKVKRIRNSNQVKVAPCKFNGELTGPYEDAQARFLSGEEVAVARTALNRKYGMLRQVIILMNMLRGKNRIYIAVEPK